MVKKLTEIFPEIAKSEVLGIHHFSLHNLDYLQHHAMTCLLALNFIPAPWLSLQGVLKALLQDRKAAETPKEARAAAFPFSARAWARLKALILLILLLYTIPGRC